METGAEAPPTVECVCFDPAAPEKVTLTLSRIITLQEWTTIVAVVEDMDENPNPITWSDRLSIGFLPGDVDQNMIVTPFDLLRFQAYAVNMNVPQNWGLLGTVEDYIDTNRDGAISPFDLLSFRLLILGVEPSTRAWAGEEIASVLPLCCR